RPAPRWPPCAPDMDAPAPFPAALAPQLDAWLGQLRTQRQLSPLTVEAYERDVRELAQLSQAASWVDISHNDIRRLTARLHGGGLGPRSIARKLSSWRGFYHWLAGEVDLPANPVDGVRAPRAPKTLPKALSVDAAVQLVSNVAPNRAAEPEELCNRAMFELMY